MRPVLVLLQTSPKTRGKGWNSSIDPCRYGAGVVHPVSVPQQQTPLTLASSAALTPVSAAGAGAACAAGAGRLRPARLKMLRPPCCAASPDTPLGWCCCCEAAGCPPAWCWTGCSSLRARLGLESAAAWASMRRRCSRLARSSGVLISPTPPAGKCKEGACWVGSFNCVCSRG